MDNDCDFINILHYFQLDRPARSTALLDWHKEIFKRNYHRNEAPKLWVKFYKIQLTETGDKNQQK